jgi:hypothetical protein
VRFSTLDLALGPSLVVMTKISVLKRHIKKYPKNKYNKLEKLKYKN